jgi:transcriptional regulator with XRE-family HTH domain
MQVLNNIQKLRWERNITLRELSKLSGVSHTEIDMIENGKRYPNQLILLKISKGLNLAVNEVFNLDWREIDFDNL